MRDKSDPIDRALESLRAQPWSGPDCNPEIEAKLMEVFPTHRPLGRLRRYRTVAAVLGAVLIGGAGLAAGGATAVKRWFVTLRLITPDGEQLIDAVLEPTDAGAASGTMNLDVGDGRQATVVVEKLSLEGAKDGPAEGFGSTAITVELDDPSEAGIDPVDRTAPGGHGGSLLLRRMREAMENAVQPAHGDLRPPVSPVIRRQINPAVVIEPWIDDEGNWQELHIVAATEVGRPAYSVYTTFVNEDGETLYRLIGSVFGVEPTTSEITAIDWDEDAVVTITFLREDGSEASLRVDPLGRDAKDGYATIHMAVEDSQTAVVEVHRAPGMSGDGRPVHALINDGTGTENVELRPLGADDR